VIGAVALSTLGGYAASQVKFRAMLLIRGFYCGELCCLFKFWMIPVRGPTHWHGVIRHGDGFDPFHIAFQTGFVTLFMRNSYCWFARWNLIEAARVEKA